MYEDGESTENAQTGTSCREISAHDGGIPIFRIRTPEETAIAQDLLELSRSLPPRPVKSVPIPIVTHHHPYLVQNSTHHAVLCAVPTPPHTPNAHGTYTIVNGGPTLIYNGDSTLARGEEYSQLTPLVPTSEPHSLHIPNSVSLSPPPEGNTNNNGGTNVFSAHHRGSAPIIVHHPSGRSANNLGGNNGANGTPLTPSTSEYSSDAENVCPSRCTVCKLVTQVPIFSGVKSMHGSGNWILLWFYIAYWD